MKKICILSAVNIKHMSMISLYTQKLKRDGISFDIIYMDKYGEEEEISAKNKYVFKNIISKSDSKLKKIVQYLKFKSFAIPILEKNNYDFIIVWNDLAILMFADYLAKNWRGKYCLNIRDYFYQDKPFLSRKYAKVINNSAFTTISSDGYKKFLPSFNYLHVHSLNEEILSNVAPRTSFQPDDEPIRISFIGNVRFFDNNKKLLDVFKNDERFTLQFFGTNANILKLYAQENGISNACFHDSFQVHQTADFINRTDIVNNLYGNRSADLDYAISIKLYHGVYNRTPILVFSGTHMASITKRYDIGYVVKEIDQSLPGKVFDWYKTLDFQCFNRNCERFLKEVENSQEDFEQLYRKFIK